MATLPVRWDMPAMKPGYTVIDLSKTGSQTSFNFAADQDVMFIGTNATVTLPRLYITGGNNIAIIGGKFEPTSTGSSASIHINGVRGNVYIEGVHIDHKNIGMMDGIGIAGAPGYRPNVYIQNTIIDNIKGTANGVHGDMVQRYGQLGDVKMYNISGSSNYQGFFLNPHPGYEIRSLEMENIDVVKNPGGDARTWTYYYYSPGQNLAYPTKLTNVYTSDRNVFPPPGYSEGAIISGDQITFPNPAFTGHMTLGRPPGGDFVTADQIGVGYTHSGVIVGEPVPPQEPQPQPPTNPNQGTDGDDVLLGTTGAETMTGGKGNDTYRVDNVGDVVVEKAGEGVDTIQSSISLDSLAANVENVVLTGTANIYVAANELDNRITGNSATNWIATGLGADTVDGGAGTDWVNYSASNTGVVADMAGTGRGGWAEGDVMTNVENMRGSRLDDTLLGDAGANVLEGNDGNDVVNGRAGNDTLTGGAGNDTFVVAKGQGSDVVTDFLAGLGLADRVDVSSYGFSSFNAVLSAATQVGADTVITLGNGETVTLRNVATTALVADDFVLAAAPAPGVDPLKLPLSGASTNFLDGTKRNDVLTGTAANDQINGRGGADQMTGGAGDDRYFVNHAGDSVVEAANGGVDTVISSVSHVLQDNIENLFLNGKGSVSATGNALDNRVQGNSAANVIDGGAGNDRLSGGGGNDVFVLRAGNGSDVVTDFAGGAGAGDVLQLTGQGFTSFAQVQAAMVQQGNHTVINFADGNSVKLLNCSALALAADDFTF